MDVSEKVNQMLRAIRPRAKYKYTLLHVMGIGVPVVICAYFHLLLAIWARNMFNLIRMSCGFWTTDLLLQYKILERADELQNVGAGRCDVSSPRFRTYHEEVVQMTAKQRALYWFTLPGLACIAKMSGGCERALVFPVYPISAYMLALWMMPCPAALITQTVL